MNNLILSYLVFFLPAIRWIGCSLDRVLYIRTNDVVKVEKYLEKYGIFAGTCSMTAPQKVLRSRIVEANSAAIVIPFDEKPSDFIQKERLRAIKAANVTAGKQAEGECCGIPILVFPRNINPGCADFFEISIAEGTTLSYEEFIAAFPASSDWGLIRAWSDEFFGEYSGTSHAIGTAACILYNHYKKKDEKALQEMVINAAFDIINSAEFVGGDLAVFARRELLEKIYTMRGNAYELPCLSKAAVERIEDGIFFGEKDLYLSHKCFAKLIDDLKTVASVRQILRILCENGVIIAHEDGTFLNRMYYRDSENQVCRQRMIKVNISALEEYGLPGVYDVLKGGEAHVCN